MGTQFIAVHVQKDDYDKSWGFNSTMFILFMINRCMFQQKA